MRIVDDHLPKMSSKFCQGNHQTSLKILFVSNKEKILTTTVRELTECFTVTKLIL